MARQDGVAAWPAVCQQTGLRWLWGGGGQELGVHEGGSVLEPEEAPAGPDVGSGRTCVQVHRTSRVGASAKPR